MPDEPDFDVIVVGAGIAGCVAAYQLAQAGYEVALVERGEAPGSKNLSGGVFYCRVMEHVFDDFLTEAPVERAITRNTIAFLNAGSDVEITYRDRRLADPVGAVTVLRAKLDPWLAERCEEAGVAVVPGMRVDRLLTRGDTVCGVGIDDEELTAKVVIAADGVNSFLARSIGVRGHEPNRNLAVGVKSVIGLDPERINERFGVSEGEGAAWALVGDCTKGLAGGGFMYTNTDSVSLGVVINLADLTASQETASGLHDHFLDHPYIAPYLAGGELLEYGCHMVAEGGKAMGGTQVADGLLVIGDAAGLTLNTGLTLRGMDLAAGSALAAARAIDEALKAGDTSANGLAGYHTHLHASFVGHDMDTYSRMPDFLANEPMYGQVGDLIADILYGVFNHDLTPRRHLVRVVRDAFKDSPLSLASLASLGVKGVRAL